MNHPIQAHHFSRPDFVSRRRRLGDVFGVLDLGSSKLACFIVECQGDEANLDNFRIKGFGHHVSQGIRAGQIIDMEAAEKSIRAAVYTAERMAGERLTTIILGVPPVGVQSIMYHAEIPLHGHPVNGDHLHYCMTMACRQHPFEGGEIIHAMPAMYALDDNKYISNPRGMFGDRLKVIVHVISIPHMMIRNLRACLERCHLEDERLVATTYASALATLDDEEMELGAFHIDMGASMSSYSIYHRHAPIHIGMVAIGGVHITHDIAHGLGVSIETAEKMKTMHGSTLAGEYTQFHFPASDGALCEYSFAQLREIIYPRLEETFQHIDAQLTQSGFKQYSGAHAVLTGGAAELSGACELAQHVFGKQVRKAQPRLFVDMPSIACGGGFSASRGLIHYMARMHNDAAYEQDSLSAWRMRMGNWFRRFVT